MQSVKTPVICYQTYPQSFQQHVQIATRVIDKTQL